MNLVAQYTCCTPYHTVTAPFFCPQGGPCGEVRLYYVIWSNELFLLPHFFSVLSMVRWAPDYTNLYRSVQNDVFLGKNLIVGIFIILFFSVDSSTCSAEDGQQGSSNVWSTYCERNQVGGIWTFQSSCAPVPASYLIVLTPVLNERYWVKQKLSLLCIPSPNPATGQFEFPLNGRLY